MILIDPPFYNPVKRFVFGIGLFLPKSVVYKYHPLIAAASRKPDHWISIEEAQIFFSKSKLFQTFHHETLENFRNECLTTNQHGNVELVFSKEDEIDIYYKAPLEIPFHFRKPIGLFQFSTPCDLLYSSQFPLTTKFDIWWHKHVTKTNINMVEFHESHFWPLQKPDETAQYLFKNIFEKERI